MPTAEFWVRGILHIDDPAGNEDAQPGQEKVLHFYGWETTLQVVGEMRWKRKHSKQRKYDIWS